MCFFHKLRNIFIDASYSVVINKAHIIAYKAQIINNLVFEYIISAKTIIEELVNTVQKN